MCRLYNCDRYMAYVRADCVRADCVCAASARVASVRVASASVASASADCAHVPVEAAVEVVRRSKKHWYNLHSSKHNHQWDTPSRN